VQDHATIFSLGFQQRSLPVARHQLSTLLGGAKPCLSLSALLPNVSNNQHVGSSRELCMRRRQLVQLPACTQCSMCRPSLRASAAPGMHHQLHAGQYILGDGTRSTGYSVSHNSCMTHMQTLARYSCPGVQETKLVAESGNPMVGASLKHKALVVRHCCLTAKHSANTASHPQQASMQCSVPVALSASCLHCCILIQAYTREHTAACSSQEARNTAESTLE
jgi:hypothetical protein